MKSYAEMAASIAAVEKMGTWIHQSGMFGTTSTAQGCVIAMECYVVNMPILEYQKRNGLVKGTPYVPYDAMAAAFEEAGGKIKLVSRTPELAEAVFTWNGVATTMRFSWEDASKEPVVYNGKESEIVDQLNAGKTPKIKSKYATPRSRATMLWARLISDSIKAIHPGCNFGTYTLEEVEDFDQQAEPVSLPGVEVAKTEPARQQTVQPTQAVQEVPAQVVQVATQPVQTQSVQPVAPVPPTDSNATDPYVEKINNGPAIEEQRNQVVSLLRGLAQEGHAGINVIIGNTLKAHGIDGGVLGLTYAEADTLINALTTKTMDAWASSPLVGHVKAAAKNG